MKKTKYKKVLIYLGTVLLAGLGAITIFIVSKDKNIIESLSTDTNIAKQTEQIELAEVSEQVEPITDLLEIMGESIENYSIIETDVYISNDSTQLYIVDENKWKKYKNKASSMFKYAVRDVEFKKQMPYNKYKEYLSVDNYEFHDFKFVGIIQIFEYAANIQEYKKGKGKYYEYLTEQRFWNCGWCGESKYNNGKNVTTTVVIR